MSDAARVKTFSETKPFVLGAAGSDKTHAASMLAQGVVLRGDISATGDLTISGKIQGTVQSSGRVVVASGGHVVGPIVAQVIAVEGAVDGELVAAESLSLHAGCRVVGDIETPTVVIEAGAVLRGRCSMPTKQEE